jgi:hypothetical protein
MKKKSYEKLNQTKNDQQVLKIKPKMINKCYEVTVIGRSFTNYQWKWMC